ncbi:MAG: glycosyltransferase [Ignavibacteriae bacterium]|nr:glycosyltransferase [Ignavibacteriota bacterium]
METARVISDLDNNTGLISKKNGKAYPFRVIPFEKEKKTPLISVVIPVLQEEKILESTLKLYTSDLIRKYNIEIIISDGGSKDKTIEIAKRYTDKIVIHQGNHRQTIAEGRNKGADISKGDILVFINGDTFPENPEHFFAFVQNWFDENNSYSHASALACPVYVAPDEIIFKDRIFYKLHNFYIWLMISLGFGMGRGECQIIKKEEFTRIGGYNPNIAAGEDFDLFRRICKIGKIGFAKEILVYESPRRFRRYGYLRILLSWTINSLSVIFRGKSVSKEWEAVR